MAGKEIEDDAINIFGPTANGTFNLIGMRDEAFNLQGNLTEEELRALHRLLGVTIEQIDKERGEGNGEVLR